MKLANFNRTAYRFLIPAILALLPLGNISSAATTDVANAPMENSSSTVVKPNVFFIIDDSGSMTWSFLPDAVLIDNVPTKYCYKNSSYNRIYYDPSITYTPPVDASGTSFPNASFTAARYNGFDSSSSTVNLSTSFRAYDTTNCWHYRTCGSDTAQAAYYYKHNSTPTVGTCHLDTAYTKITVSSVSGPGGIDERQNFANWFSYYRTRILTMKSGASRAFKNIGSGYRVGFSSINYLKATTTPPTLAGDTSNTSEWLGVSDFDSTQKTKWYEELFAIAPSGGTPLVTALSKVGRMYAGNYGPDPMQYSCQQNFTILTTDGYTSESDSPYAFQKDGTANVGNTDGGPVPATAATATISISGYSGSGANGCYYATSITVDPGTGSIQLLNAPPAPSSCTTNRTTLGNGVAASINAKTGTTGFSASYSSSSDRLTITAPASLGNLTATPSYTFTKASGNRTRTFTATAFGGYVTGSTGTAPIPYYDGNNASNTLADVAYYYYTTDLRTSTFNTNGALGTPVEENNVSGSGKDTAQHQHMTTFTLGLGVDGTLAYADNYESNGSADYNAIVQGTKNWPVPDPLNSIVENVDDLWHAAVNGRGTYFSAKNPDSLVNGLNKALSGVSARQGSAAAAATSNLEPVAGDNFAYIAVYQTVKWDGNVTAHEIDLTNGSISATPNWSTQSLLDTKASASSDTRTIYTYDGAAANKLKSFLWASLTSAEQGYFNTSQLNQYNDDWNAATKASATGTTLVNYLRGQNQHEMQDGNTLQLYRDRDHILGDIVHSQPVYVKAPQFSYVDTGYSTFKSNNANRSPTLYVGANDGMLHAFNADAAASGGGQERWAYIPPAVLPNLYRLADKNYSTNHYYFVDGSPSIGDVCNTTLNATTSLYECPDAASWKTILVGGLNAGGRAFYALDITDPNAPKALWNFSVSDDADLGLSFGNPIISKRGDGKWVVMVTSGYNNVSPGDGEGHLYILDALTGTVLDKIDNNNGSTATPSGLGRINNWVDNVDNDNTTQRIYGGDLLGNVWRFDINDTLLPSGKDAFLLATLGTSGSGQPITTKPELGEVSGKTVLFVGSGRYVGTTDLIDIATRSMYAIKDDLGTTGLGNVRSGGALIQRTFVNTTGTSGEALRTVSSLSAATDFWTTHAGWYVDLPDSGERVNVDPKLVLGTLVFASNVPNNNACNVGGYSWLYNLDYATGSYVSSATAQTAGRKITSSLVVGLNIIRLPDGRTITIVTTSDTGHPTYDTPIGIGSVSAKRVNWRELIVE